MMFEARQLKICGTCFEISICLFRVVEMMVNLAPQYFTDWSKPSAELLMNRLIQVRLYMYVAQSLLKGIEPRQNSTKSDCI